MNKYIDHTLLYAYATNIDIVNLCEEAKEYDFMSVCINPCYVRLAKEQLKNSSVKVCTVIGFPLGASTISSKVYETKEAISNGADEIDMVINISKVKNNDFDYVLDEIKQVRKASIGKILKVIIETCYLTDDEIIKTSNCVVEAKADFVKTSTGFGPSGATVEAVKLIKNTVSDKTLIKASGGIKTKEDLIKMIDAGANRIGTSKGKKII